jgi:pimeloyl-ACP methyl ester carboxylesterase
VIVPWQHRCMLRKAMLAVAAVVLLGLVVLAGAGYYFSTQLTEDGSPWEAADTEVRALTDRTATLALDDETTLVGRHGLLWEDGLAQIGAPVSRDADAQTITYQVESTTGLPPTPFEAAWYAWYYQGTPADLGLEYAEVAPMSEVGPLPSWYLPGDGATWVIAVHGHNGDRGEALRSLPTLAELRLPTVVVRYRNDEGVPSPDGLVHLGNTEWRDVDAAMTWARGQGAERFVLYGWSMGGAIALQALDRGDNRDLVDAVVLDGPVLDWRATLRLQAASRGLPAALAWAAEQWTQWRIRIDFDDFDWVTRAADLQVPVLAFHGPDDDYVPWEPTRDVAAARPDVVTLERVDRAGHTRSWNTDPDRYERALAGFLRTAVAGDAVP